MNWLMSSFRISVLGFSSVTISHFCPSAFYSLPDFFYLFSILMLSWLEDEV